MGTVLASVGLVALAIGFAVVPVSRFSPLEATGSIVLFLLTTFAAVTGATLGRRSGPEVMYWQKFERAPQPPCGRWWRRSAWSWRWLSAPRSAWPSRSC
jgi:hypothetical protein